MKKIFTLFLLVAAIALFVFLVRLVNNKPTDAVFNGKKLKDWIEDSKSTDGTVQTKAVGVLADIVKHGDMRIRPLALDALYKADKVLVFPVLFDNLEYELAVQGDSMMIPSAWALSTVNVFDDETLAAIRASEGESVKRICLSHQEARRLFPILLDYAVSRADPIARERAAEIILKLASVNSVVDGFEEQLIAILCKQDPWTLQALVETVGKIGPKANAAIPILTQLIDDKSEISRRLQLEFPDYKVRRIRAAAEKSLKQIQN